MPLTTTSTADALIGEIWSGMTADARESKLLYWHTFDQKYQADLLTNRRGDTVHIGGVNNFGTGAATLGVGGTLTYEAGSFATNIDLVVNTHAYHAFDLETEADLLSQIDLMAKLAGKSGYAVALYVDDQAAGMVDDFSTNTVGQLATPLELDDFITAERMLADAMAPTGRRFIGMSPIQRSHLLTQERFVNSLYKDALGGLTFNGVLAEGAMGTLMGASAFWTNNVEGTNAAGHDNGMWQEEAVAVAMLDNFRVREMYEIDTDSDKRATHVILGLVEVRDNHGVFMRGL